jgi:hypothetical protein
MNIEKKLKTKVWKVLERNGKLEKKEYARYIDDELFKDILELIKWGITKTK